MKKDKLIPIFLLSLSLFLISFIFGYQSMHKKINQNDISKLSQNNIDITEKNDLEIVKEDNIISPNTIIEERIHYLTCDHIITKIRVVETKFVNMSKQNFIDYLEENHPNIKLISFSPTKITLGLTKNHLCENHYIIGEEKGFIAIFTIDENGERILKTVFEDNPISLLMEIDQEKINKGIIVDSEDELTEILENFIS